MTNPDLTLRKRGSAHWKSKLTEAQIPEIRKMLAEGYSNGRVALKFKISKSVIANIKLGKRWTHV